MSHQLGQRQRDITVKPTCLGDMLLSDAHSSNPTPGPHLALKQGGHGLLSDELRASFMPGKLVALQPTHCTRLPSTS